jgi:menaquinone-dependent protoporphyrinogen IX oxidase
MKGIIIYKGKYGATLQYAEWLGEDLRLPVRTAEHIKEAQLNQYDFLLIGSSVYIGKLQIRKWLERNRTFLRNKKIFMFQVAGTPPSEKEKRQTYNRSSIPEAIINSCEFYFLPGKMVVKKLSWKDRFMLKLGARSTKDPAAKKAMLTDYDDVRKENIEQLVNRVREFSASDKETELQTERLNPTEV